MTASKISQESKASSPKPFLPHNLHRTTLFYFNVVLFVIGTFFIILPKEYLLLYPSLSFLRQGIILVIIFPLTALNFVAITEHLTRRSFSWLERLFIASVFGLTIPPLTVTLGFTLLGTMSHLIPLGLAFFSACLAIFLQPHFFHTSPRLKREDWYTLGALTGLFFAFSFVIVNAFYALPDLDPYYWLSTYQKDFSQGIVTPLHLYRPLFSSLSSLFIMLAGVDSYAYFKYLLPFAYLIVIPALLLTSRHFTSWTLRLVVFCLPFITGSFILYTHTPIPQAILNIGLLFFSLSLLHSHFTKDRFFLFFAGFIILNLSFYHEMASILCVFWLIGVGLAYHQKIRMAYRANPLLISLLFILLILQILSLFGSAFHFVTYWIIRIFILLEASQLNLSYPMSYTNIDGMTVGWGSFGGVLRYYAFYVGPITLLLGSLFFLQNKRRLRSALQNLTHCPEGMILALSTSLFFIIAEVFPRLFNIALLPERAWGFVAIFGTSLFLIAKPQVTKSFFAFFLIGAVILNAGGALYINHLKKNLITPAQLTSAEWMRTHLESNALVLAYGHDNLLRTHAQVTPIKSDDPLFYTSRQGFDDSYDKIRHYSLDISSPLDTYQQQVTHSLQGIKVLSSTTKEELVIEELRSIQKATDHLLEHFTKNTKDTKSLTQPIYVYYAKQSPDNPYAKRPYIEQETAVTSFIFDTDQDFTRIFSLPNDEIVIWQYTPSL